MNKVLTTIGICLALGMGLVAVTRPSTVVQKPVQVGSVSSPDIMSPYISVGGHQTWSARQTMTQGTTTVCSIQSPAATSTLTFGAADFRVSTSSITYINIAKAVNPMATTTVIGTYSIASGAQGTAIASTTQAGDGTLFSPNTYLVVKVAADITTGTYNVQGTCHAKWEVAGY